MNSDISWVKIAITDNGKVRYSSFLFFRLRKIIRTKKRYICGSLMPIEFAKLFIKNGENKINENNDNIIFFDSILFIKYTNKIIRKFKTIRLNKYIILKLTFILKNWKNDPTKHLLANSNWYEHIYWLNIQWSTKFEKSTSPL